MFLVILLIIVCIIGFTFFRSYKHQRNSVNKSEPTTGIAAQTVPLKGYVIIPEDLGIPFSKSGYARNVWDMQVFNGRIYFGHGNSSNEGPNQNAGPVPVIYYDPVNAKFVNQYTVNEEQIDIYKVLEGKLYIPGHDPRDSWDLGNFYKLDNDQWIKIRSIPDGVHAYDMEQINNKLYTAIGSGGANSVYVSKDEGKTWTPVTPLSGDSFTPYGMRAHTLLKFNNKIYALGTIFNSDYYVIAGYKRDITRLNRILIASETGCITQQVYVNKVLPQAPPNIRFKLVRASVAFNNIMYIAGQIDNDHQWIPEGLYYAPEINQAKRVIFPEAGVLPTDILVRGNAVYILTHRKIAENLHANIIYKTNNLTQWTELFRFEYETFARSFEELNGDFYFGMGCNTNYIAKSTGKILRIKLKVYQS